YESVRVRADAACISRAEMVYERLRQGKSIYSPLSHLWRVFGGAALISLTSFILLFIGAFVGGMLSAGVLAGSALLSLLLSSLAYQIQRSEERRGGQEWR